MNTEVKNVVIVGGGTAGWMAAAAISKKFSPLLKITLIESDEIGTIGVGEATIPPMRTFHKLLDIDEQVFMRATEATFKLGIMFENWGERGDTYIHAFGQTGKETWLGDFHHFWLRAKELGIAKNFGTYCFEHQAAKANKFSTAPNFNLNYAYHLDATRYAKFLRQMSEAKGTTRIEGKVAEVTQDSTSGFIKSLRLESGQVIEGDLFIDCTGFRGLLIEETLKTGYEDWSHWLPCDRAIAVQTESTGPALPYTRSIAHDVGWRWKIPLQHRVGNGLVYCSRYLSEDDARNTLLESVEGKTLIEPRVIKFQTGRRKKTWNKNCVAIGLSSGFIEPLESTSIHLIMIAVSRLMQLFPFNGIKESFVNEFNQISRVEMEQLRDFIVLHYKTTEREDTPFWSYCKNMEIPSTLAHRLQLFKETGHAYQADGELFRIDSWTQVMFGQRLMPEHCHHLTKTMSERDLRNFLKSLEENINRGVSQLPPHSEFVKHYCAI